MANPDTKEPERTDEQRDALKRQVSGIPKSLYDAPPVNPEAEKEAEAEQARAKQLKTASSKSAEDHRTQKAT